MELIPHTIETKMVLSVSKVRMQGWRIMASRASPTVKGDDEDGSLVRIVLAWDRLQG